MDDLIRRKPSYVDAGPAGGKVQGARPEPDEIGLATLLRRGA